MKKLTFILLLTLSILSYSQSELFFWNSILPNRFNLSIATDTSLYQIYNSSVLQNLSGIVATGFKDDTLFATDGQTLYVILNDTIIAQYRLNPTKASKQQAYIVNLFYTYSNPPKKIIKIITAVNDTLKIFTWNKINQPEIVATGIEPIIAVRLFPQSYYDELNIAYLKNQTLYIYQQSFTDTILNTPVIETLPISYKAPVTHISITDIYIAIVDDTSTTIYYKEYSASGDEVYLSHIYSYHWKAKDIVITKFFNNFIFGTDTAIILTYFEPSQNPIQQQKVYKLPQNYVFQQFIPTVYGQLLIYPAQPDSLFALYNYLSPIYYTYLTPIKFISDPFPNYMNIVQSYFPLYYFELNTSDLVGCSTISIPTIYATGWGGSILKTQTIELPEPNKIIEISDTIPLPQLPFNTSDTSLLKTYLKTFKLGINISENNIWAGIDVDNEFLPPLIAGNLVVIWYYNNQPIDTTDILYATEVGQYRAEISNSICSQDTTFYLYRQNPLLWDIINYRYPWYYIENKPNVETFTFSKFNNYYIVADTPLFSAYLDSILAEGPDGTILKNDFNIQILFDGQLIANDNLNSPFEVYPEYSGPHYFDMILIPKNYSIETPMFNFRTLATIITPKLKSIQPNRIYDVLDTTQLIITTDTTDTILYNSDIYFNDQYNICPFLPFKQITPTTWQLTINCAQKDTLQNPEHLKLLIYLTTNKLNNLTITLTSPDGKTATIYNGFNSDTSYYIIGHPYCKNYAFPDNNPDTTAYYGVYPLIFSQQNSHILSETDFSQSLFSDCAIENLSAKIFNYTNNQLYADFTPLNNAKINGTWTLKIIPNSQNTLINAYAFLQLPAQITSIHYFPYSDLVQVDTFIEVAKNHCEILDDGKIVMKSKGKDTLTYYFRIFVKNLLTMDDLNLAYTRFYIEIKKQAVYYDEQTYSFSPNGDGINDYWNPITTIAQKYPILKYAPLSSLNILIINDKGLIVRKFNLGEHPQGWDGLDKDGTPAPAGIYWFFVIYRDQKYYGTIFLIR